MTGKCYIDTETGMVEFINDNEATGEEDQTKILVCSVTFDEDMIGTLVINENITYTP